MQAPTSTSVSKAAGRKGMFIFWPGADIRSVLCVMRCCSGCFEGGALGVLLMSLQLAFNLCMLRCLRRALHNMPCRRHTLLKPRRRHKTRWAEVLHFEHLLGGSEKLQRAGEDGSRVVMTHLTGSSPGRLDQNAAALASDLLGSLCLVALANMLQATHSGKGPF